MWEDEMISMTVVACGCHDKPLFEQPFPMNTLGVIGQDIMFCNVVNASNRRSFPVAFSAEHRDIHFIGARSHVGRRQDIVFSMTFGTGGSIRGTPP
jgi:hypothetical protein